MKYACICGWIGAKESLSIYRGLNVCPDCLHKRRNESITYPILRCPWCKTDKHVQLIGQGMYHCHQCHRTFDADPDEGGDYDNRNPAKRLEREEARKVNRTGTKAGRATRR